MIASGLTAHTMLIGGDGDKLEQSYIFSIQSPVFGKAVHRQLAARTSLIYGQLLLRFVKYLGARPRICSLSSADN
eukprot:SAG31_NODE_2141_length_6344_cov_13.577742_9_plen_75_part_00